MSSREVQTHSADETIAFGHALGAELTAPLLILLKGDLGAGKTTLTKGIVSGAGAALEEEVTSPTFTLIHKYAGGPASASHRAVIYHIDLYRIEDRQALETLGLQDIFDEKAIIIVEWAGRLVLPANWPVMKIALEHVSEDVRKITVWESAVAVP